jgi:tetratricopeptide (TPR) repeat protein
MSNGNITALVNYALLALQAGHQEKAIRSFKNALEIKADIIEAHIGMGLAYSRMGKYVEMAESFRRAIQISPETVRQWAAVSISHPHEWLSFKPEYAHLKGKMAEFLHNLDEADALTRVGAVHISNGAYETAVNALEYCLTLVQDYEAAIVLLTAAYLLLSAQDDRRIVELGKSSVLQKAIPELAKLIFSN